MHLFSYQKRRIVVYLPLSIFASLYVANLYLLSQKVTYRRPISKILIKERRSCFETKRNNKFPLIIPHVKPCISPGKETHFKIAVVVNSACTGLKHRRLRETIRKTWGNSTALGVQDKYKVFFSLGICKEPENDFNAEESKKKNDILIGNFTDNYSSVSLKSFMALRWAYCSLQTSYIIKSDDDVYIRVHRILKWLDWNHNPSPLYGGFLYKNAFIFRHPKSPWFVSYQEYNDTDVWPPFALGACTVFSSNSIPLFLNYTQHRTPFKTDDAFIGVAARDLGIKATQIPGFKLFERDEKKLDSAILIGDGLDVTQMKHYHSITLRVLTENVEDFLLKRVNI